MTSPRKEKREETFFAKENARLRKLKKKKAKNKSGWFSQPSRLATGKPGVSERLADMLGPTPGKRVAGLAASAGVVGAPLGGAANLAKVGVHALSVRARLARLKANAKKAAAKEAAAKEAKRKNGKAKGGLIKSSRKKSKIDGIARRGKTRGKHR